MKVKLPTSKDVVAARKRIGDHVDVTPIFSSVVLDDIAGANLLIKAECLQGTGSFKLRGATNRLLQIPKKKRENGVVAFSSGNHAQGVARAARRLGIPALIVSLTIVAFGTSAPELLISVQSVFEGVPGLALGNVVLICSCSMSEPAMFDKSALRCSCVRLRRR